MASSTREKILAVSLRLFNEQGYRNVTMRAIADALSISVGNLTYHFAKKQDIVAALKQENGPLHLARHTHLRARLIDGKPIAPCGRRKIEVS